MHVLYLACDKLPYQMHISVSKQNLLQMYISKNFDNHMRLPVISSSQFILSIFENK